MFCETQWVHDPLLHKVEIPQFCAFDISALVYGSGVIYMINIALILLHIISLNLLNILNYSHLAKANYVEQNKLHGNNIIQNT